MPRKAPGLAISAMALAILWLVFFWIVPLGIILSLAGLLVALLALAMRPAGSPQAKTLSLALALSVFGLVIEVWTSWDMIWSGR
jgi:hypothetical protein